MAFDAFASLTLPTATSLADIETLFDRLGERCAEVPGVTIGPRLIDRGPERADMNNAERNLFARSARMLPFDAPPPNKATTTALGNSTMLVLPIMRPRMITTSPRLGLTIDLAPGCTLECQLGYLDPAEVPIVPELEAMVTAFCPPGWRGQCLAITESALEPALGGIPNAIAAHLAAIAVYDRMREVGFTMQVRDQADFHTRRDVNHLAHTLGTVLERRIELGNKDILDLLGRLARAFGATPDEITQLAGPTPTMASRLSSEPEPLRKAEAEERILDLLRVIDRTPRDKDRDPNMDAMKKTLGL